MLRFTQSVFFLSNLMSVISFHHIKLSRFVKFKEDLTTLQQSMCQLLFAYINYVKVTLA